jgi:hypothetical protein
LTNDDRSTAHGRTRPYCAGCGERIGVYEPIWLHHDDGTLQRTSWLALNGHLHPRDSEVRLFHIGCLATDTIRQQGV